MLAADDDARNCKKPCRFDAIPNLPGLCAARLDKGLNRPACEMNVYQHGIDVVIEVRFIFFQPAPFSYDVVPSTLQFRLGTMAAVVTVMAPVGQLDFVGPLFNLPMQI